MFNPWFDVYLSAIEAQHVIWLRTIRIAKGGKSGAREAKRMISEKIEAAGQAGAMVVAGAGVDQIGALYQRKIRANRKRLTR